MSSLEANYGETNAGDYWRGRLDTGWHREDNELRLALEAIRRRQTGGGGMDDELALLLDARWGGWSVGLSTRYHRRDERNRVNLYSRVAYTRQWLHRYTLGGYLAFGRHAALETENQIEAGMAVEF